MASRIAFVSDLNGRGAVQLADMVDWSLEGIHYPVWPPVVERQADRFGGWVERIARNAGASHLGKVEVRRRYEDVVAGEALLAAEARREVAARRQGLAPLAEGALRLPGQLEKAGAQAV